MEPEHETTLAFTRKIELGKDIVLSPSLCNFQVHLQQFTINNNNNNNSSDAAATVTPQKNELYHLILIPKSGYQTGREFIIATFDSEMAAENRSIPIDLLVSVLKPNELVKNGQTFVLRLIKKGTSAKSKEKEASNADQQQSQQTDGGVYGILGGIQITSFTAAQFLALKASKKKQLLQEKQQKEEKKKI